MENLRQEDGISVLLRIPALARYIYYNFLPLGSGGSSSAGTAGGWCVKPEGHSRSGFLLFSGHSWSEPSRISESHNQHVFFHITRVVSNMPQLNLLFELVCLTEFLFCYIFGPSALKEIQLYLSFRGRCWSDEDWVVLDCVMLPRCRCALFVPSVLEACHSSSHPPACCPVLKPFSKLEGVRNCSVV